MKKSGSTSSKEFLFDSIKAIFGFWDRQFGNIVFLDFSRGEARPMLRGPRGQGKTHLNPREAS